MLGAVRDNKSGVFCFERARGNRAAAVLGSKEWSWLWNEAWDVGDIDREIYRDAIRMEHRLILPSLMLFPRSIGETRVQHESIREGTILTLSGTVVSPEPATAKNSKSRKPTLDETRLALQYMGDMLGISPWGKKFGYGRFDLHEISVFDGRELRAPPTGREHPDNSPGEGAGAGEASDVCREEDVGEESEDRENLGADVPAPRQSSRDGGASDAPGVLEEGS